MRVDEPGDQDVVGKLDPGSVRGFRLEFGAWADAGDGAAPNEHGVAFERDARGFDGHEPAGSDQEFIGHGEAEKKSPAVGAGLGSRVTATGIAFDQFAGLRSVAVMKTRRSGA